MQYTTKDARIGGMEKKVLVVTADRELRRDEIGDVGSIVDGYCATFPRDGSVETWFFYADDKDLLVKNWIAANTSEQRITVLEDTVLEDEPTDDRELKLREVGKACSAAIYAGVDVKTSEGTEHFSLTEEDQINIQNLMLQVQAGQQAVPYHADGEVCRPFTAEDVMALATAATAHKTYHLTYCNHLNVWIRREEDHEVMMGIVYGAELPEDLLVNMENLLEQG